jgi:hypothetical protein
MTDTISSVDAAREHADQAWLTFTNGRNLHILRPHWREEVTPDGSPLLSGQVVGRLAERALRAFAADFYLTLPHPGDIRPQLDTSVPDRVVLVWRRDGVWVELWHPAGAVDRPEPARTAPEASTAVQGAPKPAPTPSTIPAARRSFLSRPGARLPFTRRNKTPKETPAA